MVKVGVCVAPLLVVLLIFWAAFSSWRGRRRRYKQAVEGARRDGAPRPPSMKEMLGHERRDP